MTKKYAFSALSTVLMTTLSACGASGLGGPVAAPPNVSAGSEPTAVSAPSTSEVVPAESVTTSGAPTNTDPPPTSTPASSIPIEYLVYDIPGLDPALRVGEPRGQEDALAALAVSKPAFGGLSVGDPIAALSPESVSEDAALAAPLVPVGRIVSEGGEAVVIGWADQAVMHAGPTDDGFLPIAFIYDERGIAIGSVPLPDSLPSDFPRPGDHD